ncbi:uncharacterized protein TRUGW13939_07572 [Talaromyces rugulosus]|uniref:Uncharacterized protein n=1 Tax=Talaromyces rugulosus TaxID=121627 RepID=A0A7H8R2E8_TALRU|nr:uncharacterized protein TRUGW13939_07572 [Talaromyces rugulosus]QKX60427.1 hypothetical protein TRUGW13939_07572 [Talaromyces rugulosus]
MPLPAPEVDFSPRAGFEGRTAYQLISKLLDLSSGHQQDILRPRISQYSFERILNPRLDRSARMMAVLRHAKFRRFVHLYCTTKYGEKNFSWSLICDIINSKLDMIWLPKLEEFLDFGAAIFQENMTFPSASGWEKIMGAEGQPHESLLLLFFPSGEIYYDETGKNYTDKQNYNLVLKYEKYNKLNDEASALIGDPGFRYRRSGFLTKLSDKAYVQVNKYVFKRSTLSEGGTRPWQGGITDSEYARRSRVLIENIWNEVAIRDYWKENSILLKQLKNFPIGVPRPSNKTEVENYMDRFNYDNWSHLVKMVIEHAGPCLAGPTDRFNDMIDGKGQGFSPSPRHERFVDDLFSQNNRASQLGTVLNNIVSRNKLAKRLKVSEEMWFYCELKSTMLNNVKFGMRSKYSTKEEQINIIKSTKLYNVGKDNLLGIAYILHENGIEVDVDNLHEDISKFDTSSDHDPEKSRKMRFQSAKLRTTRFSGDTVTTESRTPSPYSCARPKRKPRRAMARLGFRLGLESCIVVN